MSNNLLNRVPSFLCNFRNVAQFSNKIRNINRAAYGGRHTVSLMPGDGVGPELMQYVKDSFRLAGAPVDFEMVPFSHAKDSLQDLENVRCSILRNGIALKGSIDTTKFDSPKYRSRNADLRAELDLFANVIKCKTIHGVKNVRHRDIDVVIIREGTEGEYSQLEHEAEPGVVESLKIITAAKSLRIAKYAFNYAKKHNRKKVTAVHKANIMKLADGLFLDCCKEVSKNYPDIEFESLIVDNCCMQMTSRPNQFDVMVLPNLYGNIVANIAVGLVGGAGLVPGVNFGEDFAVFETGTRNLGKNIAGQNIANPTGILLASADLLDHLGLELHATIIKQSVFQVLSDDQIHTPDIGGDASSSDFMNALYRHIRDRTNNWYDFVSDADSPH